MNRSVMSLGLLAFSEDSEEEDEEAVATVTPRGGLGEPLRRESGLR